MGFFGKQNPVFIDLDRGIVGTFDETEAQGVEEGYVYPIIVPFNSFRHIKYSDSIPKTDIHHVFPSGKANKDKGAIAESQLVVVFGSKEGGIMDMISKKQSVTISQLKDRIKDQEIEIANLKQRAEEAYSGAEKVVTRSKQLSKSMEKREIDPNNPLSKLNDNW